MVPDLGHSLRNGRLGHCAALAKRTFFNHLYARQHGHPLQAAAAIKCIVSNLFHSAGDRHAPGQAAAA